MLAENNLKADFYLDYVIRHQKGLSYLNIDCKNVHAFL